MLYWRPTRSTAWSWLLFVGGFVALCTVPLLAQAAGAGDAMTREVYYDMNVVANQGFLTVLFVTAVRWMKQSELPIFSWIHEGTWMLNRGLAVVGSLLIAMGITYTYGYDADVANGQLTIVFTGLSAAALLGKFKLWVLSFAGMQGVYRATKEA